MGPLPWPFSSSWLRHAHRIREPETLRRRARFTIFGLWRHGADSRGFKILQVVDLTGADIMAQVSAGTWFVDFYAPQYAPQLAGLFFSCCHNYISQCHVGRGAASGLVSRWTARLRRCQHCQALEQPWEQLAAQLQGSKVGGVS